MVEELVRVVVNYVVMDIKSLDRLLQALKVVKPRFTKLVQRLDITIISMLFDCCANWMIYFFSVKDLQVVTLDKVQTFIDMGRLKPPTNGLLTIRDLLESGLISRAKEGVKLLVKVDLEIIVKVWSHMSDS